MTENLAKRRRITLKYKSANPLFEQWLTEWKDEAKAKGSKLEYTYRNALTSLKKCPIVLETGRDCKILKGFGDHLCKLLDQKLRHHKSTSVQNADQVESFPTRNDVVPDPDVVPKKKSRKKKEQTNNLVLPVDIEGNNLESVNNLVIKENTKLATQTTKTLITKHSSSTSTESEEDFYILEPGKFDIILYIDTAETSIADPLCKELSTISDVCQFEVKKLQVGDYVWVCRDNITKKELVLPYIFERKRLDDLASSIKDGRYREQKYRLKRSGIENKYYLIEEFQNKHVGLPITSLQQAAVNTAIQDGFRIKYTTDLKHTARILNKFSYLLASIFKNNTLVRCPKETIDTVNLNILDDLVSLMSFNEFNRSSIKNKPMKVTDMFIKMLIQIQGMSIQKAMALTQKYPTPMLLQEALTKTTGVNVEKCISELSYERQKIGPTLSKAIVQLFTSKTLK